MVKRKRSKPWQALCQRVGNAYHAPSPNGWYANGARWIATKVGQTFKAPITQRLVASSCKSNGATQNPIAQRCKTNVQATRCLCSRFLCLSRNVAVDAIADDAQGLHRCGTLHRLLLVCPRRFRHAVLQWSEQGALNPSPNGLHGGSSRLATPFRRRNRRIVSIAELWDRVVIKKLG